MFAVIFERILLKNTWMTGFGSSWFTEIDFAIFPLCCQKMKPAAGAFVSYLSMIKTLVLQQMLHPTWSRAHKHPKIDLKNIKNDFRRIY